MDIRMETCTPKSPMLKQVRQKVTKINARIISKAHAHLQTMEKTCAKFQKDWYEELSSRGTHCLYTEGEK